MSIYSMKNFRNHEKQQKTVEDFKTVLNYNAETGKFWWRNDFKGRRSRGKEAGHVSSTDGYRYIQALGFTYSAHRLVWLFETGSWPENQIDHKNGVRDDNRFCNLRDISRAENSQNISSAAYSTGRKCSLGVYYSPTRKNRNGSITCLKKPYAARIYVKDDNGKSKCISLGYYSTDEEAHAAYIRAKMIYHPFSARIMPANQ